MLQAAVEARERAAKHGVDIGTLAIKQAVKADGVITLVGMRAPEEVGPCICSVFCLLRSHVSRKNENVTGAYHRGAAEFLDQCSLMSGGRVGLCKVRMHM